MLRRSPDFDRSYVTALARGLSVLKAFGEHSDRLTLSDVARITALPRASARRALITLQSLGYIHSDGKLFSLSPQVLTLARAYLAPALSRGSRRVFWKMSAILWANPARFPCCMTIRRSTSRARPENASAHCIAMSARICPRIAHPWAASSGGASGFRTGCFLRASRTCVPPPYTITGKTELRGALEKVRRNGYSLVDQELEWICARSRSRSTMRRACHCGDECQRAGQPHSEKAVDRSLSARASRRSHQIRPLLIA